MTFRDPEGTLSHRVDAVVLAGGRSTRFGSDKRIALFCREELIRRAVKKVSGVVTGTVFVATGPRREHLPGTGRTVVITDSPPGRGPMGGIAAALERSATGVLVLGCDLPLVSPATLVRVLRAAQVTNAPVAVRSMRGWEPLVAYWPRRVYKLVRAAITAGRLAPHTLLDSLGTVPVTGLDPAELINVNTRADLERAVAESRYLHPDK